jgi:tRNA pseudouridine38-40 synthase
MARYFLEVAYKGTRYSGFQVQENSNTIQAEVEKAFQTFQRIPIQLTGSSRTDAGVHALQNYFHFDFEEEIHPKFLYKINAILPADVVVKNIFPVSDESHSRFDAISREYIYKLHNFKDPFLTNTSLYYPYKLDFGAMQEGASFLKTQQNFFPFSKTNTQVKNFNCTILRSEWSFNGDQFTYNIEANRFLRGMVRLITATLLKIGRGSYSFDELKNLFEINGKCGYSVPAHGLYLQKVAYPINYFPASALSFTRF